ncbi:unnamed protein product [Thelazia callipaeda]|uniref:MSP domain-containing protein n=1 Tax=Thelazia callipaeda TaxID=103827 RepID=A0A0N5CQY5_THECL|nr:unnamed protein product [Thelazia callipaeda]
MDRKMYEFQEIPVAIIWNWASVQIPLIKINSFISKVSIIKIRSTVMENLDNHPRECAFVVYCDARFTSLSVTRELEKITVNIKYKCIK